MNIIVDHIDTNGNQNKRTERLTRLGFLKHLAIAGQGYAPRLKKLMRTIGMFIHYSLYIQKQEFNNNKFSVPPKKLSDPTEKGQFSTLVGKAIADYLSKRIDNSLFTVNYEAEMRLRGMKISGGRPDLLSYTKNSKFAIEAKGYGDGIRKKMTDHKTQSTTGHIPVNFTVACVSYNLYKQVKCNYHDPFNNNIPYDNESLQKLTRNYYQGLSDFLDKEYFEYYETQYQNEKFIEVELSERNLEKPLQDEILLIGRDIIRLYRPRLILPGRIIDYAKEGITNELEPFNFELEQEETGIYIDNDRVGIRMGN